MQLGGWLPCTNTKSFFFPLLLTALNKVFGTPCFTALHGVSHPFAWLINSYIRVASIG